MGLQQMKIFLVISIQLLFFWKEKISRDGKNMLLSSDLVRGVADGSFS
jgi:hypothetical protein